MNFFTYHCNGSIPQSELKIGAQTWDSQGMGNYECICPIPYNKGKQLIVLKTQNPTKL